MYNFPQRKLVYDNANKMQIVGWFCEFLNQHEIKVYTISRKVLSKLSEGLYDLVITEAEYQGRKVKLNDPFRLPSGSNKKFGVYVINDKGNVVKVTFGDPNMGINRDDPEARKNFRARHNCDQKKDKTTPGYWSCKFWEKGKSVTDLMKG